MQNPFIYLRSLRHVDHTVFAVSDGQKYYYDSQFGRRMAYSSGQQVKRSIIESLISNLETPYAPITFRWYLDYAAKDKEDRKSKAKAKEGLADVSCDPSFPDQLLGGYMLAESDSFAVKRRSPLSISAMRPLHPLLGGMEKEEENMTFDRSNNPSTQIKVFWRGDEGKGKPEEVEEADLHEWLDNNKRNLPTRKFIQSQKRASGLFVYDAAIDMRTLFSVSTNKVEPELFPHIEKRLVEAGWIKGKNVFGNCLICPKEKREAIILALAQALINWRITSNQARTFSLMETLAVAVHHDANQVAYAIRGNLLEESESDKMRAEPMIDETSSAEIFVTPSCAGYIRGAIGEASALDKAAKNLADKMLAFDYENQTFKAPHI